MVYGVTPMVVGVHVRYRKSQVRLWEMLYGVTPMGVGVHVRTVKVIQGDERWYTV